MQLLKFSTTTGLAHLRVTSVCGSAVRVSGSRIQQQAAPLDVSIVSFQGLTLEFERIVATYRFYPRPHTSCLLFSMVFREDPAGGSFYFFHVARSHRKSSQRGKRINRRGPDKTRIGSYASCLALPPVRLKRCSFAVHLTDCLLVVTL